MSILIIIEFILVGALMVNSTAKHFSLSSLTLMTVFGASAALSSPLSTLRFYNVDDQMAAYITNSEFSDQLILQANFLEDTGNANISNYIRKGHNVIRLTDINGPVGGWTYGYDFRLNGVTYAADNCGSVNSVGCDGNDQTRGLAWSQDIEFNWNPRPKYTLRFYDVDDQMSAFITNGKYTGHLILKTDFSEDSGYIDITNFVKGGLNQILIQDINGPAGWTIGYDFQIDGVTYSSDACGIFNTFGCNDDEHKRGLVYSKTIEFGAPADVRIPEPATLFMFVGALAGYRMRSRFRLKS